MKSHVNVVHLGIRSFNCSFCDRTFSSKHNLKTHEKSLHSDQEKGYHCQNCLMEFKDKSEYEEHSLICSNDEEEVQYVTQLYDVRDVSVEK